MSVCEVLDTEYGLMLVASNDWNQTRALRDTGRGVHHERMLLLAELLGAMPDGRVVVDAGANLGAFAVPLSAHLAGGMLHAFEPQPVIFNMLAGSLALTQCTSVRAHNVALGDRDGRIEVPQFNYESTSGMNFGSIEFGPEQIEGLNQTRGSDTARVEFVPLRRLDSYDFPRLDLMKIDVQRMEIPLLTGAAETLSRCRPVLFIEWVGNDRDTLAQSLTLHGYRIDREVGDDWLCFPV